MLDLLADGDVMNAADIAERLEKPVDTVRRSLSRMVKDGQVERVGRGKYQKITEEASIEF